MNDALFDQQIQARDLKKGMQIVAPEHGFIAKKIRDVTVTGRVVIVNYAQGMGGRTFRPDELVEVV